jgi:putative intracellular protease/amidase
MVSVGLVLYPRFTALDIVGPFQTLVDVPGLDVFFVAEKTGLVSDHTGRLSLVATKSFADVDQDGDVGAISGTCLKHITSTLPSSHLTCTLYRG